MEQVSEKEFLKEGRRYRESYVCLFMRGMVKRTVRMSCPTHRKKGEEAGKHGIELGRKGRMQHRQVQEKAWEREEKEERRGGIERA